MTIFPNAITTAVLLHIIFYFFIYFFLSNRYTAVWASKIIAQGFVLQNRFSGHPLNLTSPFAFALVLLFNVAFCDASKGEKVLVLVWLCKYSASGRLH